MEIQEVSRKKRRRAKEWDAENKGMALLKSFGRGPNKI